MFFNVSGVGLIIMNTVGGPDRGIVKKQRNIRRRVAPLGQGLAGLSRLQSLNMACFGRSQLAGGREFRILIISAVFEGMPLIDRQRLVTGALCSRRRGRAGITWAPELSGDNNNAGTAQGVAEHQ